MGSVTPDSAKFSKESKGDKEDKEGKEGKEDAVDPRRTFQYLFNFEEKKFSPLSATINTFGTRKPTNAMVTEGSSFETLCWSTQEMMDLFPEMEFHLLNARRGNFNWDCSFGFGAGRPEHPMLKQANETWSRAKIELVTSNDCATAFGEQNASSIFKVLAKLHQLFNLDSGPRSIK